MAGELPFGLAPSGELTAYTPTLRERVSDWLRPMLFSDDRAGQEKANRLTNWAETMIPPFGFATQMYDTGRAGGEGNYAQAALLAGMAAIPGKTDEVAVRGAKIIDMLKSGKAKSITDEMLDMGNPALNARLNDYLFQNYDLPMDAASRMQRASDMGMNHKIYHGSRSDIRSQSKFEGTSEGGAGVLWSTDEPSVANTYATPKAGTSGQNVVPLRVNTADYGEYGYVVPFPDSGTDKDTDAWLKGVESFNRRLDFNNKKSEYFSKAIESARNKGKSGAVIKNVEDDRVGTQFSIPSDVYANLDPSSIRSIFARFDPRLSHLSNLNAGIASASALLGYNLMQNVNPAQADELKRIEAGK